MLCSLSPQVSPILSLEIFMVLQTGDIRLIFHNKIYMCSFLCSSLLHSKEKEKYMTCVIERKDVGGGENWGILEVRESKEGIFLYQIRRG